MKYYILSLMLLAPVAAVAQDVGQTKPVSVAAEARVDFNQQWIDGDTDHEASGFKGRYLNVQVDGGFAGHFTYSLRQRLNKKISKNDLFEATDWAYLTYAPTEIVKLSAGKQVVAIGGYEYDRAPIDIYGASEYWNNIACYQFGVSAGVALSHEDWLTAQVTQSPFQAQGMRDVYAYNLQWNGSHGPWQTIWTVNLMEYARSRYISYIALGNRLSFGNFHAELDFMNRSAAHQTFLFKDCSVMANIDYRVTPWLQPFAKYTYDVNHNEYADLCVLPGTEISSVNAGVEAWPLNKGRNRVRIHFDLGYCWGKNGNAAGALQNKQLTLNAGLTWHFQIL